MGPLLEGSMKWTTLSRQRKSHLRTFDRLSGMNLACRTDHAPCRLFLFAQWRLAHALSLPRRARSFAFDGLGSASNIRWSRRRSIGFDRRIALVRDRRASGD